MRATVYIPDDELERFLKKLQGASKEVKQKAAFELATTAKEIDKNAKRYAPVNKQKGVGGRMRASIKHIVLTPDNLNHKIEVGAKYGVFVEKGTRAHVIRPRVAKMLAFEVGGKLVMAKEVHHPGTRPQPFLRPAYLLGVNRFYAKMRNLIPN